MKRLTIALAILLTGTCFADGATRIGATRIAFGTCADDDAPYHPIWDSVSAARPDVFVEYTKPDVAKRNVLQALGGGAHVVIGTSGLTADDLDEVDGVAREAGGTRLLTAKPRRNHRVIRPPPVARRIASNSATP